MTATCELPFEAGTLKRPPLRYHGGKWKIAPWIISHFPSHRTYVEVFGGGAGVMLRKPQSTIEVYNDLEGQVVNFFRVIRNQVQLDELLHLLSLTPFSREEFELSHELSEDPVEAARRFVTRLQFGHGTSSMDPRDSNGFRSCDIRAGKSYAREWTGIPEAVALAAERFRPVTIEHLDFRKLIPKFDDPATLFYVDPPYPMFTRQAGGKGYVHEMSNACHRQLAWLLKNSKAKVIISSYPNPLYDELFEDWNSTQKATTANGQVGAVPRTESLWMNFVPDITQPPQREAQFMHA